jgi:hypothetical protein
MVTSEKLGALAGPIAFLGTMATAVVAFHGDGHDPSPTAPMVGITIGSALLRTRGRRLAGFVPLCVAVFLATAPWGLLERRDRVAAVAIWSIEGLSFALLFMPVVLASVRTGSASAGPIAEGSRRRAPWVVAAGLAPAVGGLARAIYSAWLLSADLQSPLRHSRWESGVNLLDEATVVAAIALAAPDVLALTRNLTRPERAAASFEDPQGRERRALVASVVTDLFAVAFGAACTYVQLVSR